MRESDRSGAGRVPRDGANQGERSEETIARPARSTDPFRTTERDGRLLPRAPGDLPSTLGDGPSSGRPDASPRGGTGDPGRDDRLPNIPGYEILGELNRGGMGVVYRARQLLLDRPCALKMILTERSHDPDSVARFLAEARAVARLRHPNIVVIHSIGQVQGRPYLELEYVDGESLARKLGGAPQPIAQAAGTVQTLARAIEESHRSGIVHRDVKPGNVLLTRDGTPKIGDFGLAKVLHEDSEITRTHSIMGSPCYMAPEQAGGRSRQVGPSTDVYALGVILYEMLTGIPPFKAESVEETLELVRTADPLPPSRLRPKLPPDLETITLTCLRKEPTSRYPSAAALADDLGRFLAGRAILARRPGPVERGLQWSRRNPAEARLVAALVVVVIAAMAGLSALWVRAERLRGLAEGRRVEAEGHLSEAERRRVEALRNLLEARAAVDAYLARIGGSAALRSPALRPLRRELLQAAGAFHRRFLAEQGDDPGLRAEMAAAQLRLARVHEELLDKPAAEAAYRAALAGYESLARERPGDDDVQDGLAQSLFGLACCRLGDPASSGPLDQAIAIRERLAGRSRSAPGPRLKLAEAYQALAAWHRSAREDDEALRPLLKAREIGRDLAREFPGDPGPRHSLGVTLFELAALHRTLGRPGDALEFGQQAIGPLRSAFLDTQLNPWYGAQLARACDSLGAIELDLGRADEALRSFAEATRVRRRVAQANPALAVAHSDLIASELDLARRLGAAGRADERDAALERAREVVEGLPGDDPGGLYLLACVHALNTARAGDDDARRAREADAAVAALRRAIAAGWRDRDQIRDDPDLAALRGRGDFREIVDAVEGPRAEAGSPAARWRAGLEALEASERLTREHPDDPAWQADLAAAHRTIGLAQLRLGQVEPGLDSLRAGIAILERHAPAGATGRPIRVRLARDLATLAGALWEDGRWKLSRAESGRSLRAWEGLLREAPDDPEVRAEAAAVRAVLARAVFQTGRLDEARSLLDQSLAAVQAGASAGGAPAAPVAFSRARVLALAVAWHPGLGERDREDLAAEAVRAIREALAAGHRDDGAIETLPDFDPLRGRPEFVDMVAGWSSSGLAAESPPGRVERLVAENLELLTVQESLLCDRPGDPRLRSALAMTHAALGDARRSAGERAAALASHRLALQGVEDLAAERPGDAGLRAARARLLIALATDHAEVGLWEEAGDWLERALAIAEPEGPEVWSHAILLRALRGDEAGARDLCERAVARFGDSEHPLVATILARASALLPGAAGPADRLERLALAAIDTYPDQAWVRFAAGAALYRIGRFGQAESELLRCLELEPAWPSVAVDWAVLAMTSRRLGRDAEARAWLDRAEAWWATALREVPRGREFRLPVPWWDFAELEILLREARRVVAGAVPADEAGRWRLRARAHAELGDPGAASADLRCACEGCPDDPGLAIELGLALIASGRDDEADAQFRKAAGLRPGDAGLLVRCGRAWADSGRRGRADAYFDEAVTLRPDDPATRVARGRHLAESGDDRRADADFERAARAAGDDPNAFLDGWWVAGPYPDASEPDAAPGPASPLLASDAGGTREVAWRFLADGEAEPPGFARDFRRARGASAYAMGIVFLAGERDVTLLVSCDPSARLWLNGRPVLGPDPLADRADPHPRRVPVTLRAGRNVLLARVANGLGEPRFTCRAEPGAPPPSAGPGRR